MVSTGPVSGALMKHDSFPGAVGAYGFHNYVSIPPSLGSHILTAMLEGCLVGVSTIIMKAALFTHRM